ncbi:MAG: hypothetical protein ACXVCE_04715, partial [Bacteriovorax sp.]
VLFFFPGCSFFTKKVESLADSEKKSSAPLKTVKKNLHCPDNNKVQLLLEDEATLKFYRPFINTLFESKKYSFAQKAAMISLIEMIRRPDEASPSARLQIFFHNNNKNYYYDFRPVNLEDDSKMPYLKGLDVLLKIFDHSKTLSQLSDILDEVIPRAINVSSELENFLVSHKDDLEKNESFSEIFLKGGEVLTKYESFKRMSFKKIVTQYNVDKLGNDAYYEMSKNALLSLDIGQSDLAVKCNFDINKENTLKEDLINSTQKKSHYFALKDGENFFVAVSSAIAGKSLKTHKESYLLKALPNPIPLPICQFRNNQEDLILISTTGRNPEQHLKHLVTYDINLVDSYQTLEELLTFSRHLFLSNPDRILYESKRGRKSQLDFFLSMNFPIYHVPVLGNIIGSATFKTHGRENRSLIIDERSQAKLWCGP